MTRLWLLIFPLFWSALGFGQVKFDGLGTLNQIILRATIEKNIGLIYTGTFQTSDIDPSCGVVQFSYGSSEAVNVRGFGITSPKRKAIAVDLILSQYPKNLEDWIIPFEVLVKDRLLTLFQLDSTLNDPDISYRIVFQQTCQTEEQAKKLFHGFVIYYNEESMFNEALTCTELFPGREYDRSLSCGGIFYFVSDIIEYKGGVWVSNQDLGVFYSRDSGLSYIEMNAGFSKLGGIQSLCVFKDKLFAASSSEGIFWFNAKTESWESINLILDPKECWVLETNGDRIFAIFQYHGLYSSEDGVNWTHVPVTYYEKDKLVEVKISARASIFFRNQHMYLTNGKRMFYSNNSGVSWKRIHLSFDNEIAVIRGLIGNDSALVVVAHSEGVYVSYDNGLNWKNITPSEEYPVVDDVLIEDNCYLISIPIVDRGLYAYREDQFFHLIRHHTSSVMSFGRFYIVGSNAGKLYRIEKDYITKTIEQSQKL